MQKLSFYLISFSVLFFSSLTLLNLNSVSAQHQVDVFDRNVCSQKQNNSEESTICKDKEVGSENPFYGKEGILTKLINLLTTIVGIIAIIVIILAGLKFISSGSNPQDVSKAREQIIYAVIALIVAASAQLLVRVILERLN